MLESAVSYAVVLPTLLVAHQVADHWVQSNSQDQRKGLTGWPGRLACARHVATYTLTTALLAGAVWLLFGLPISPAGFLLGQAVSAVTHYWADRRFTLRWLCERLGKGGFYRLGVPRNVRAISKSPMLGGSGTFTTSAGRVVDVELVDGSGEVVEWDNPSLGTGAYALDQSWHWFWLFVAAMVTVLV